VVFDPEKQAAIKSSPLLVFAIPVRVYGNGRGAGSPPARGGFHHETETRTRIALELGVPRGPGLDGSFVLGVPAHQRHKSGRADKGSRIDTKITPRRVARGRVVFAANCARCHRADSTKWLVGPGLKGLFKRKVTPVFRHPVTEWTIQSHIRQGSRRMPPFPHLKGRDMNGLIAFLKTI